MTADRRGERDDSDPDVPDPALTPEQSLALIGAERRQFARKIDWHGRVIFGMWGVVWALSATLYYLMLPGGPELLPRAVPTVAVSVLIMMAIVASVVLGVRSRRQVRGPSRASGARYGFSWLISFGAVVAVNVGLTTRGMPAEIEALLWSSSLLVVLGVLCLSGGALRKDRLASGLGGWLLLGGVLSVFVGVPGNYLVLGLFAGFGLVVTAILSGRVPTSAAGGRG